VYIRRSSRPPRGRYRELAPHRERRRRKWRGPAFAGERADCSSCPPTASGESTRFKANPQRLFREYWRDQSTSNGENRGELRQTPEIGAGSTFRSDYLRSSDDRSAWTAESTGGGSDPCGVGAPFRTPGLCGVPWLRLSGQDTPSPHQHSPWLEPWWIPTAVGAAKQSSSAAPVYSEHPSAMARARGLGRRLATPAAPIGTRKESPAVVSTAGTAKAKSARRSRPVSKSNVAGKVAAPMPARRRRSRALIASPSI